MDQDRQESRGTAERDRCERRVAPSMPPPYVTEDGFVLYDRREARDSRGAPGQPGQGETARESIPETAPEPDLVTLRMQHLSAMYHYVSAQARAQAEVAKESGNDWYKPVTTRSANGV